MMGTEKMQPVEKYLTERGCPPIEGETYQAIHERFLNLLAEDYNDLDERLHRVEGFLVL